MLDLILEGARAAVLAGITVFVWHAGRRRFEYIPNGWPLVLGGFALVTFGSLIDITDNIPALDRFVVVGDTPTQAFLEKVVGYLGGFVFLAVGLYRWLPRVGRLAEESAACARAEEELRQREFQLREIIDLVPHMIFIKDREGRFRLVNKAVAEAHGTSPEALIGETSGTGYTRKEEIARQNRDDREVMETGKPKLIPQETLRDADGNTRIMRVTKVPYIDPESGETWVLGVAVDINELQTIQEALHHVQKLDALGRLTGGIVHDFNNLLTIILGNIQLVERGIEDPRLRKFVGSAEAAAQRGAALTKRLLAFGRQALEPKVIDLNELVLGLTDMLARTIGAGIEINTATLPGLHKTLADPAQVENVILNLVINARDAMPEGGTLTIETASVRLDEDDAALHGEVTPGDYVMVAVTDTGVGMPADVADRAFDPFFTTKDMGSGSGLGLSMVYGFCRQSGGHAVIESAVGAGTTIRIYLPDAAAGDGAWPQKTVLVVADDPAMRGFAVTTLIGLGYDVLEAADAGIAAGVLESNGKIDLLFTDIMLPEGADGRELAASATARHPAIRVLYATGRAPEENSDQRPKPGGVQLLYKPYSGRDLATNIGQLLGGPRDGEDEGAIARHR